LQPWRKAAEMGTAHS